MKKYTITDKEWESVLNKVQTLEKENQRLTGVIEGMEKAFSLYGVMYSVKTTELLKWCDENIDRIKGWISDDKTSTHLKGKQRTRLRCFERFVKKINE
tara:strand:- start:470 stop:763 length:294 start_codon:yes stop_codon:yes gene_type:complete